MLERMKERGHPDLAEEYHKRHKAIETQRRYTAKQRELSKWRERLNEANDPQYATYVRKQIVKCEKYLEERQQ